jgi:2-dehydropantoate 2-reductase
VRTLQHKASIVQDLENGRPMEFDAMFGAPLEFAHLMKVPAPTLELLVALVRIRAREAGCYEG